MGFCPTKTDADSEVSDLRVGVDAARIARDIKTGNTELTARARDFHDGVEHRCRLFNARIAAMTTCFKSDAVDSAIDFGYTDNLSNLLCKGSGLLQVDDFTTKTLRLCQPLGNHVSHDDDGS